MTSGSLFIRQVPNEKGLISMRPVSEQAFSRIIAMEMHSLEARLRSVAESKRITLVPSSFEEQTKRSGLTSSRLHPADLSLPVGVFWRQADGSALTDVFLDVARVMASTFCKEIAEREELPSMAKKPGTSRLDPSNLA